MGKGGQEDRSICINLDRGCYGLQFGGFSSKAKAKSNQRRGGVLVA
jgi:hypothetical protein